MSGKEVLTAKDAPVFFEYINENFKKYFEPLRLEIEGLKKENQALKQEIKALQKSR